jgi:hypothetical protein
VVLCPACAKLDPAEANSRVRARRAFWARQRRPAPPPPRPTFSYEAWRKLTPAGLATIEHAADSGFFAIIDGTTVGFYATVGEAQVAVDARVRAALGPRRRAVVGSGRNRPQWVRKRQHMSPPAPRVGPERCERSDRMDTDNVVVFTEAKVRSLAGITQDQLRYWAEDLARPVIDRKVSTRHGVRLYDFDGVLTVLILAELKQKRGFSLQYLRQVVAYVAKEGLDSPSSGSQ